MRRPKHRRAVFSLLGVLALACAFATQRLSLDEADRSSPPASEEPRDPWMRPFESTSIWNMPIGSGARLEPASLPETDRNGLTNVYLVKTDPSDPEVELLRSGDWRRRCSGTEPTGYTIHLPPDFKIEPPFRYESGGWHTPNNGFVFLLEDGRTLLNGGQGARCKRGGPVYGHVAGIAETSLYGDGIGGGHGASHLSHLGGAIRLGELEGPEPIRHVLDLAVYSKYLYSDDKRTEASTFRWPATSSDRYALDRDKLDAYVGDDPNLRMGSLLALPGPLRPSDLDIETRVGRKLFAALQDYGAYITDDSAREANLLHVDAQAGGSFPWGAAQREEFGRMVARLHVVTNNGPNSIGGGGTPRRALLPELAPPFKAAEDVQVFTRRFAKAIWSGSGR